MWRRDDTPGLHTPEQVKGWSLVTRAMHEAGGRIFAQLWHVAASERDRGGLEPVSGTSVR